MALPGPGTAALWAVRRPVRKRLVGSVLICFGLAAGACHEEREVAKSGFIEGVIRDERSGEPLKGARVVFTADTLETSEGRSGKDGHYAVHIEARTAKARLRVSKGGYATRLVSVFLDGEYVVLDVDLARSAD